MTESVNTCTGKAAIATIQAATATDKATEAGNSAAISTAKADEAAASAQYAADTVTDNQIALVLVASNLAQLQTMFVNHIAFS